MFLVAFGLWPDMWLIDKNLGLFQKPGSKIAGIVRRGVVTDDIGADNAMAAADLADQRQQIGQSHATLVPVRHGVVCGQHILVDRQIDGLGANSAQHPVDEIFLADLRNGFPVQRPFLLPVAGAAAIIGQHTARRVFIRVEFQLAFAEPVQIGALALGATKVAADTPMVMTFWILRLAKALLTQDPQCMPPLKVTQSG